MGVRDDVVNELRITYRVSAHGSSIYDTGTELGCRIDGTVSQLSSGHGIVSQRCGINYAGTELSGCVNRCVRDLCCRYSIVLELVSADLRRCEQIQLHHTSTYMNDRHTAH